MAAPVLPDALIEHVLSFHDHFDPPEGFTAEVIEGTVVVSPTPSGRHAWIFKRLLLQLEPALPAGLESTNNITLHMPATDERYIPDLVVLPTATMDTEEWLLQATDAELVAEIVSPSNSATDRVTKVRGYAASGVPIYLLVDPLERTVTLFSKPAGESYQVTLRVMFGEKLDLPEPFTGVLDTGQFS